MIIQNLSERNSLSSCLEPYSTVCPPDDNVLLANTLYGFLSHQANIVCSLKIFTILTSGSDLNPGNYRATAEWISKEYTKDTVSGECMFPNSSLSAK